MCVALMCTNFKTFVVFVTLITVSKCIPDPCSDQFEVVTDFTHGDCGKDEVYVENENPVHNCFPGCINKCDANTPCYLCQCAPGYYCPNGGSQGHEICEIDESSCFKHHTPGNQILPGALPTCLPDGRWAPKQCKGEGHNGRCFCYDAIGNRIFGHEFTKNAENMTCACSRKRVELMSAGSQFYTTLHCDSMGNYEPMQCDNGQCWCAESKTGEITANVVPEKMMKLLPCYSKQNVGEQYLRQCESEEYAQKKIMHELKIHGTEHANFHHIMCDADGTYGHYQIENNQAYCKWKDNTNIGSYQISLSDQDVALMNCNCARDKKMYELAGLSHTLSCNGNGNYLSKQTLTDGRWFYVDSDGIRTSDYFLPENN